MAAFYARYQIDDPEYAFLPKLLLHTDSKLEDPRKKIEFCLNYLSGSIPLADMLDYFMGVGITRGYENVVCTLNDKNLRIHPIEHKNLWPLLDDDQKRVLEEKYRKYGSGKPITNAWIDKVIENLGEDRDQDIMWSGYSDITETAEEAFTSFKNDKKKDGIVNLRTIGYCGLTLLGMYV